MSRTGLKRSTSTWIAATVAVAIVLVVVALISGLWIGTGDSEINVAGWVAMGFGVVAALALGIGLMSLVFFSSRRGYDERSRRDV
jgi:hypothetical protein